MFVALNEKGVKTNLLEVRSKKDLVQPHKKYYCPACSESLVLKCGATRQWHFAHRPLADCHSSSEPESAFHLSGKEDLYSHFKKQQPNIELETYFKKIQQRSDLFLPDERLPKVLEFQCASASEEHILKRSLGYMTQGIDALWILGSKRLKRRGLLFKLSGMDQLFIRASHPRQFHPFHSPFRLFYYCPTSKMFLIIDHLQAISKTLYCGILHTRPLGEVTINDLFNPSYSASQLDFFKDLYLNRKASLRLRFKKHLHPTEMYVRRLWYEKGMSFAQHPGWVGLPHSDYTALETASVLWQSWIYVTHIYSSHSLSLQTVISDMELNLTQGLFKKRNLFCRHASVEQAVRTYFYQLEALGMIRQETAYTFLVAPRAGVLNRSMEGCLNEDRLIIDYLTEDREWTGIHF